MFIAQPSGRVIVDNFPANPVPQWAVLLSLKSVSHLLFGAIRAYSYFPDNVELFDISLAFVVPLLLSGRAYIRNYYLQLPSSVLEFTLVWGLSLGYTPEISHIQYSPSARRFTVDLSTMCSRAEYADHLRRLRATSLCKDKCGFQESCTHGLERFRRFIGASVLQVERDVTSLLRSPPVVRCTSLVPGPFDRVPNGGLRVHNVLSTSKLSVLARYYNSLDLHGVNVGFWDFAGLGMPHRSEEYLANSYIQKMLQ
ncbi:P0 protein [Triticum yellow stripe virus]|uniref:P0 protein n=1 Tax=Triticum yellow stripe virus TaxID=3035804 RepID=A0AA95EMB2_9VIRU|nr:P0 protein [Triticum yellow stripe virus]